MSIIDMFNLDTILYILDIIDDQSKIRFLMTNQNTYSLFEHVKFLDFHDYDKIKDLRFRNKFKRVIYKNGCSYMDEIKKRPEKLVNKFFIENSLDVIPISVTDITFGWDFNESIKNCIPNTITNLTFGHSLINTLKIHFQIV
ncbi:putative F-box and FNIP repeat-containing protein [Cotonvirus japonicus]|uniref:F-box and FNIP repeat-containing protein n=1 Tax=Cotonvirus japonicus TaxID=2811091 RepID=A0ABM7NST5_9VIRU|nr:putative F-box and FNIP repeat-containing protein [Cotonvirus japonicus]BCS83147.1 putative F-box and FNIP repeat-containing protein [Cotonvirus japonicus]